MHSFGIKLEWDTQTKQKNKTKQNKKNEKTFHSAGDITN